jgi:V/A-type H+-transporting ATPase subunit I
MSIVQLKKLTFLGHAESKEQVIDDLQGLGCVHLIPLNEAGDPLDRPGGVSRQTREALQFLASCSSQRHQVSDPSGFDPVAVEAQALALQQRLFELQENRDYLSERLQNLRPWGEFAFSSLQEMQGLRLWFYVVPRREIHEFDNVELPWEIVNSDHRYYYVIVISAQEPENMPFDRTLTGARSPERLARRLEQVEVDIEDAEAERAGLTRWTRLLARSVDGLEDLAARRYAAGRTFDREPVFALQAWAPIQRLDELRSYAATAGLVLEIENPAPDDQPPTLFENTPALRAGEDLVSFYRTPDYRLWDPSSVVFFSFALFFAMIVADAGYGLLIAGITAWLWKDLGGTGKGQQWRLLLLSLSASTVVYGVLAGGYFGLQPPSGSLLGAFHLIDINDAESMMTLTVLIGAAHVILANVRDSLRLGPSPAAFAPLGWIIAVLGGLLLGSQLVFDALPSWPGLTALAGGLLLVLCFSGYGEGLGRRTLKGAIALTRVTKAFGDVLSYLRLFALGLASASLAVAFNDMAAQVRESFAGLGLLLALLILVFGHALNFVLAIASGVIHGLRLNFIEFFDWGVQEEGNPFRAFRRKGVN